VYLKLEVRPRIKVDDKKTTTPKLVYRYRGRSHWLETTRRAEDYVNKHCWVQKGRGVRRKKTGGGTKQSVGGDKQRGERAV